MWKKMLLGSVGFLIALVSGLFVLSWQQGKEIAFPVDLETFQSEKVLGEYTYEAGGEVKKKLGLVYGFLPYWNVDNYQVHPTVSHLSYFRLAVNGKGEIMKQAGDGGYQIYEGERIQQIFDQVGRQNMNLEVTFFSSQSGEIYDLIQCESCQDKLVETMAGVMERDRLDGINLDFEYVGAVSAEDREKFTLFIYKVKNMMQDRFPRAKLSIDVYGGAAKMENIWDFPKIAKIVDRVMVMGYDYKTRRSSVPGPTAPTLGKSVWGGDIWEDIRSLLRYVPSEKVILVVPFYGYAWETTTGDLGTAKTYPDSGETMTYRGAQNILKDRALGAKEKWDEKSLTPYLTYYNQETERWHIGFFENPRSLGYKMDLIETLNLGGIAVWALGYEGEYQELWEAIGQRF